MSKSEFFFQGVSHCYSRNINDVINQFNPFRSYYHQELGKLQSQLATTSNRILNSNIPQMNEFQESVFSRNAGEYLKIYEKHQQQVLNETGKNNVVNDFCNIPYLNLNKIQ